MLNLTNRLRDNVLGEQSFHQMLIFVLILGNKLYLYQTDYQTSYSYVYNQNKNICCNMFYFRPDYPTGFSETGWTCPTVAFFSPFLARLFPFFDLEILG
jgi:hypothetical protein